MPRRGRRRVAGDGGVGAQPSGVLDVLGLQRTQASRQLAGCAVRIAAAYELDELRLGGDRHARAGCRRAGRRAGGAALPEGVGGGLRPGVQPVQADEAGRRNQPQEAPPIHPRILAPGEAAGASAAGCGPARSAPSSAARAARRGPDAGPRAQRPPGHPPSR